MGVAARFALLGRNSEKSACRTHGGGGVASRMESALTLILTAIRSTRSVVRSSCARTSKPCRFTAAASEIDLDDGMEPCGMDRTQIPAPHLDWQRPPSLKPGENYFR